MNKSVKQMWVEALESGKYRQAREELKVTDWSKHAAYCCLGVLCNLAVKNGVCTKEDAFSTNGDNELPRIVYKWAGLTSPNPIIGDRSAIVLNDADRLSFKEIAKEIRKNL